MIRALNYNPQPCPCSQTRVSSMGDLTETLSSFTSAFTEGDWKTWALVAAVAIALYLAFSNTPKKQERAVQLRKARASYKGQVERIREEYR